ncbi:hypothetical protein FJO69_02175 [[Mycoplasma] falconis]|uniref:Uncharacterized protein n=1 Tax=[Mycoplasma] falconis TaxID=92403 RepID=A0A501X9E5_9BACT|nr:hypothetical protein [[Mycoplasma] falconis]TPE57198.1 hypothetical protein FJO69_02175 [[Mycoplasma] falconis]
MKNIKKKTLVNVLLLFNVLTVLTAIITLILYVAGISKEAISYALWILLSFYILGLLVNILGTTYAYSLKYNKAFWYLLIGIIIPLLAIIGAISLGLAVDNQLIKNNKMSKNEKSVNL